MKQPPVISILGNARDLKFSKKFMDDMEAVLNGAGITFPIEMPPPPYLSFSQFPRIALVLDDNNQFVTYPVPPDPQVLSKKESLLPVSPVLP